MQDGFIVATLIILGGAAVVVGTLTINQSRLLYYPDVPSRAVTATPDHIGLAYESVKLRTADGLTLDGWFLPRTKPRGVVLFFHGNAGNMSHRLDSLQIFHELGLAVLIIDYRGYGNSEGTPSEQGTYLDAQAAWDHLVKQRGVQSRDVVIFGRSLGAAIAANLAAKHTPGALILESGFTSVPNIAADLYPLLPARLMTRFSYDTEGFLDSIHCPVLIVHSRDDELIPFEHGLRLYATAREPKRLLEIGGDHGNGFLVSRATYVAGLDAFLSAALNSPPSP